MADVHTGLTALHVSGRGQIAITSYGGIFRLVLEEGHTYRVCVKYVIAVAILQLTQAT